MRKQQKIINLYNEKNLYAIKQVVSVSDEEDLNQLWEHIVSIHLGEDSKMYVFMANLYELSARFLEKQKGEFFEIIIEQSDEYYYFTVWNKAFIHFSRKEWKKRRIDYRFKNKRISIRLLKQTLKNNTIDYSQRDDIRVAQILQTLREDTIKNEFLPYTFMHQADLIELIELAEDMNTIMYEAQQSGLSINTLVRIRSYFSLVSLTLSHYEQIEQVSNIMIEFSIMINQYKETFSLFNTDQIELIEGFTHNFERWLRIVFIEGGADLHFMDRSLRADVEMIRLMIEPPLNVSQEELDSIFDF